MGRRLPIMLLAGLAAVLAAASPDPVRITAVGRVAFTRAPRVGWPLPLVVELDSQETEFVGALVAACGGTVTRQEVRIGRGRFRFCLYPPYQYDGRNRIQWRLVDAADAPVLERELRLPDVTTMPHWSVVAVSPRERQLPPGILAQPGDDQAPELSIVNDPALLPDRWYGYLAADAVVWDGAAPAGLLPAQRQALGEWVAAGGRLIVMVSPEDRLLSPVPDVQPTATLARDADGVPVAPGFSRPAGMPYSERRHALGSIVLAAGELAPLLRTMPPHDRAALFGRLLPGPVAPTPDPTWRDAPDTMAGRDLSSVLADALRRSAGFAEESIVPMLFLGLLYILAIAVGDYLVLRRWRHLGYTWVTFPILILVAAAAAVLLFRQPEIDARERQEIVFHDVGLTGDVARRLHLGCLRHDRDLPVRLRLPQSTWLAAWHPDPLGGDAPLPLVEDLPAQQPYKDLFIHGHAGTYTQYRAVELRQLPRPFTVALRRDGRALVGIVARHYDGYVRDAAIIHDGYIYRLSPHDMSPTREVRLTDRLALVGDEGVTGLDMYGATDALPLWLPAAAGRVQVSGERPPGLSPSDTFLALTPDTAMVVAFVDETEDAVGAPVRRRVCIRQLAPVSR